MAQFYGRIIGRSGVATRTGTKSSGLSVEASTWSWIIDIELWDSLGVEHARVSMREKDSRLTRVILFQGPLDEEHVAHAREYIANDEGEEG